MAAPTRAPDREVVFNRIPLLRANRDLEGRIRGGARVSTTRPSAISSGASTLPACTLRSASLPFFDLPVEAMFLLEPFERLGAEALLARPASRPH